MKVKDGSLELMKWIAIISMTIDHVNKYLFNGTIPYLYEIGRLALPLFVFVLAFNLARPGVLDLKVFTRIAVRLFIFGLIASVPFVLLGGLNEWYLPLNVLFTLLVITCVIYCFYLGGIFGIASASIIFLIGGGLVEFGWIAVALGFCIWAAFKYQSFFMAGIAILCCIFLKEINGNFFALVSLLVIAACCFTDNKFKKIKYFFYIYYPLHLFILFLIRIPMAKAGYFFIGA